MRLQCPAFYKACNMNMPETTKSTPNFSFVQMEHDILDVWETNKIFEKSLENTASKKPYIFYDGPPFATGLPHHGHIVASTIKDIVPRYWTMKGRHVMRRFGWDCHGLPIEHEIDKQLGITAAQAVKEMGVSGYNDQCRAIVQRYVSQWRHTITRLGRWVDFENDYKTMDCWYMESVWWVAKQLWEKGLIYQGVKVMPVSTALGTPLSNFEANQNYIDVQDPAVTVLFKLVSEDAYLSVWTTTPWTLPANLAICVGPDIDYVLVHDEELDKRIYIAESRLASYGLSEAGTRIKGSALVGKEYNPLFPYFVDRKDDGAFRVLSDQYVSTDSGTGLVHQAPAFGEEDHRVCREAGLATGSVPVDAHGLFTEEVWDFAGQHVKDADKNILRAIRESGSLYRQEVIQHSYPFCYRSDTPLIYRAIPSWYVRVTDLIDPLVANNQKINWVPDHIKDGRFGNWLEGAIDWSISRNRVWGTPIPIWVNDESGKEICIGSLDELEAYTGHRLEDLHREHVDGLTFQIDGEQGTYRRIEEVFDCWFESGSMPYAQLHYPFEGQEVFAAGFPAEFIAEGLDQTRGWFYTLTVLATALYDQPAFRNVVVNGMVMAEDGKKMSKRLRNYTAPDELMELYGADALRLYLINSGLMKGEEQRFSDAGVREMTRRALLPWYNAFSFLTTYAEIDNWSPDHGFDVGENVLDQWILSRMQTLKKKVSSEMEAYRLYNVVPQLFRFIEDLTNWYIRLNRARFWGEGITLDKNAAYATLYRALFDLSKVMAPFTPFLSDYIYLELGNLARKPMNPESVHLCDYPESEAALVRTELEESVSFMQRVILLGRQKREEAKIGLRTPLRSITLITRKKSLLDDLRELEDYIKVELNVLDVDYDTDEARYIRAVARPNFPVLGKRLGPRMKAFQARIKKLTVEEIDNFQLNQSIVIEGEAFTTEEILISQQALADSNALSDGQIAIDLDCELSDDLIRGGYAREIVRRVQDFRKELSLNVSDRIVIEYGGDPQLLQAIDEHQEYVMSETLAVSMSKQKQKNSMSSATIDGLSFYFGVQEAD